MQERRGSVSPIGMETISHIIESIDAPSAKKAFIASLANAEANDQINSYDSLLRLLRETNLHARKQLALKHIDILQNANEVIEVANMLMILDVREFLSMLNESRWVIKKKSPLIPEPDTLVTLLNKCQRLLMIDKDIQHKLIMHNHREITDFDSFNKVLYIMMLSENLFDFVKLKSEIIDTPQQMLIMLNNITNNHLFKVIEYIELTWDRKFGDTSNAYDLQSLSSLIGFLARRMEGGGYFDENNLKEFFKARRHSIQKFSQLSMILQQTGYNSLMTVFLLREYKHLVKPENNLRSVLDMVSDDNKFYLYHEIVDAWSPANENLNQLSVAAVPGTLFANNNAVQASTLYVESEVDDVMARLLDQ